MIVRALYTAALSLCLLTAPLLSLTHAAESNVVAQVGSVPVTIFDIGREQQRLLPFNANFHTGVPPETLEKIKNESLTAMIDQAYKVNYALDKKMTVDKKIIDERVEKLKKKFKTEKELKTALSGESLKDVYAAIERTLLAQKAEELAVQNNINVTDADVRAYYDTNKQMYKRPKQFKASHILIKVNPSSNAEERATLEKKAKELTVKAKNGEDFYNLAYYNSDDRSKYVGGDLGYFHEGQTVPEFEDAVKKMKVGEISDPVKSMYGWHIIKLVELNEPRQLEFDETKVKIREQLEKATREKLYNSWMADLKAKYPVKKF
jgi:parvulin-like peptidyl-prolyl isomerase